MHCQISSSQLHWRDLIQCSDEELAKYDIAAVNLACAIGLPETKDFDILKSLHKLEQIAQSVYVLAQQCPWFQQHPEKYGNSFNLFRVHVMFSVLYRDFNFYYSSHCMPEDSTPRAIDTFIHGLLQSSGGNCASLPVVFIAVGRQLGYPLKLVKAKCHYFVRWDEPDECFNIEVSMKTGSFDSYPDDHYRQWPHPIAPEREPEGNFLISFSPRQELATFLNERGFCWHWYNKYQEAVEAFIWAKMMEPENRYYGTWINEMLKYWGESLQSCLPPNFPRVTMGFPKQRRYPERLPIEFEHQMMSLETLEEILYRTYLKSILQCLWHQDLSESMSK